MHEDLVIHATFAVALLHIDSRVGKYIPVLACLKVHCRNLDG